jgi:hypothetical protein
LAVSSLGFPAITRSASPNSKRQVASVGVNGMGFSDIKNIGEHAGVQFVGFCDIDSKRFDKVDGAFPGVAHFADFREMFAKLGDQIDAVSVATPDHMHAAVAMAAMRAGKHVYCQKPLAQTVWEARQMRLLAAKKGVVTQMGNQIHSNIEYRLGTRLIREGAIGKIKEVHSWVGVTGHERNKLLEPPAAGACELGFVDWGGADAGVLRGVSSVRVAGLAGFWRRGAGGLWVPHFGSCFYGSGVEGAVDGGGAEQWDQSAHLADESAGSVCVSGE